MSQQRENFGSAATAIMALAGSAIGLGNIWRFPYMVGQNGGAAFIIVYLAATLLLSLPIMLSESIIGHKSGSNPIGAMDKLAPGSRWKWLGYLTIITPLVIVSYYSVVGGWSLGYFIRASVVGFASTDAQEVSSVFGNFISSPWLPLLCHTLFVCACAVIISAGVKGGIEKFNKFTMPGLFILIVVIMVYSLTLPGASKGVEYLIKPDFKKLTGPAIASAMGQSFYSLSLGVGTILTYSSYIKKEKNIFMTSVGTIGADILFALIAGFAIMPAVFAAGIEPGAGPGLIFETLPYIFAKMGVTAAWLVRVIAILFFLMIVFAALTSAISLIEVGVAFLIEEKKMTRGRATFIIVLCIWALGALCSLSFGPLAGVQVFGKNLFSFCDILSSNFLMTFGGLLFVVFAGWKMKREDVRNEFTQHGTNRLNCAIFDTFYFILRFVAPVAILVIFLTNFLN